MKAKILTLAMMAILLLACNGNDASAPEDSHNTGIVGPDATMIVLKFSDVAYQNLVMAGDRVLKRNIDCGATEGSCYDYDEESELLLLSAIDFNMDTDHRGAAMFEDSALAKGVDFLEQKIQLRDGLPYVPLADGYVLIDWRWVDILPISSLRQDMSNHPKDRIEHIQNHCFLTDMEWQGVTDVRNSWDRSLSQSVEIEELWEISYRNIDKQIDIMPQPESSVYWDNFSLYLNGLSVSVAAYYDQYIPDKWNPYLTYCQDTQERIRQYLIEMLRNNELPKIGIQWR